MTVLLLYTHQYGAHALEQSLPSWRSPQLSVASRLMMGACKPLSLHAGALMQAPTATVSPEDTVSPILCSLWLLTVFLPPPPGVVRALGQEV